MNLQVLLAIVAQVANYLNLIGSWAAMLAAELDAQQPLDPAVESISASYNVIGNQIVTISAVLYCLIGQIEIGLLIEPEVSESNEPAADTSTEQTATSDTRARLVGQSVIWRIKRKKRLPQRQWRINQHYRSS